jgi:uncharacterized membrane protein YdjX (TVP38/TMEM64 family)
MTNPETPKTSKPHIATLVISALVMAALIAAMIIFWQPLTDLFSDPNRTRELIAQSGPWGPLLFIAMQIAQVLVAPIPGQVTGFVGGFLFGAFWGTVYTTIGAAIGFTLIFVLARKLGRPFVAYFVDKKLLEKFDYLAESKGVLVLFLIFLLPAFPDDIICYIAGLTTIKIRTLVLISLLGRLPGNLLLSITGSGVAESNTQLVVVIVSFLVVIGVVGFWQRKRIERWIHQFAERSKEKKNKQ